MTNAEIKARIEELEEQSRNISRELYDLKELNKGYWIGIGDDDYSVEYYRLGWCTETEAICIMNQNGDFKFGFDVKEVTKEYNEKMFNAQKMQKVVGMLSDEIFSEYKAARDSIESKLYELKRELDIPEYCSIY